MWLALLQELDSTREGEHSEVVLWLSMLLCCESDLRLWAGHGAIRLLQMERVCCLSECVLLLLRMPLSMLTRVSFSAGKGRTRCPSHLALKHLGSAGLLLHTVSYSMYGAATWMHQC